MPDKVILKWNRTQGLIERTMDSSEIWMNIFLIFLIGFILGMALVSIFAIIIEKKKEKKPIPPKKVFLDPTDEEMRMVFMPIFLNLLTKYGCETNGWNTKESEGLKEMAERLAEPIIMGRRADADLVDTELHSDRVCDLTVSKG